MCEIDNLVVFGDVPYFLCIELVYYLVKKELILSSRGLIGITVTKPRVGVSIVLVSGV